MLAFLLQILQAISASFSFGSAQSCDNCRDAGLETHVSYKVNLIGTCAECVALDVKIVIIEGNLILDMKADIRKITELKTSPPPGSETRMGVEGKSDEEKGEHDSEAYRLAVALFFSKYPDLDEKAFLPNFDVAAYFAGRKVEREKVGYRLGFKTPDDSVYLPRAMAQAGLKNERMQGHSSLLRKALSVLSGPFYSHEYKGNAIECFAFGEPFLVDYPEYSNLVCERVLHCVGSNRVSLEADGASFCSIHYMDVTDDVVTVSRDSYKDRMWTRRLEIDSLEVESFLSLQKIKKQDSFLESLDCDVQAVLVCRFESKIPVGLIEELKKLPEVKDQLRLIPNWREPKKDDESKRPKTSQKNNGKSSKTKKSKSAKTQKTKKQEGKQKFTQADYKLFETAFGTRSVNRVITIIKKVVPDTTGRIDLVHACQFFEDGEPKSGFSNLNKNQLSFL
jgi:hypothetical protein